MDVATNCVVCAIERAEFTYPVGICSTCRIELGNLVLGRDEPTVRSLWKISTNFSDTRHRLLQHEAVTAPEVIASVAWGLFVQGLVDEGLIIAAQAIGAGDAADINGVGASALRVLFDEKVRQEAFLERARSILGKRPA